MRAWAQPHGERRVCRPSSWPGHLMCTHTIPGAVWSNVGPKEAGRAGPKPRLVAVMVTAATEVAALAAAKAPGERGLYISGAGPLLHLLRGYYVSGPVFDRNSSYAPLEVGGNVIFYPIKKCYIANLEEIEKKKKRTP